MPDRIDVLEQLLKSISKNTFVLARTVMHDHGLPAQTMPVLGHVTRDPGMTISELARRTGIAKSQISMTVDSLCDMGFLEKRADPSDQRLVRIYPTAKAEAFFQEMHASMRERLSDALSTLPEEKIDTIIDGLQSLSAVLQQLRRNQD